MTVKTTIIRADQTEQWNAVLSEIGRYSLYHLPWFHRIAETAGQGRAEMPVVRCGPHLMAFPMLIRPIDPPASDTAKSCADSTSVRAFAGPVSSQPTPPEDVRRALLGGLNAYFEDNHIVCAFSRLHPLTSDCGLLNGYGVLVDVGVTLSMDLTLTPEQQWANYRRDHKKVIGRIQRKGYICTLAGEECLDDVVSVYSQTMRRVGACEDFFYGRDYFQRLLHDLPNTVRLFVCKDGDSLVGFHICGSCGGLIESYLSGTADKYVQCAPSRLLYEAIRLWGNETGAKTIHLGGGVGTQRDQLYEFKSGFATHEHTYRTWRHVIDTEAYDRICLDACSRVHTDSNTSYFPAYRDPDIDTAQPGETQNLTLPIER